MVKLAWQKSQVKIKNSNKQVYCAKVHKNFTMNELRKQYQELSDNLNSQSKHNLSIACTVHYSGINKWCAGQFTNVGESVVITDVSYNQAFDDCDIDGVEFYCVTNDEHDPSEGKKLHPKKSGLNYNNQKSMFTKK
jgi:hypothetical protein